MTDLRTAAQQALDYWEQVAWGDAVMADKMDALRAALAQQAEPTRSQQMADAGFKPRDRRLECDECGGKFTAQMLPIHKCAQQAEPPPPLWPPTGLEPRGCPLPGACSCPSESVRSTHSEDCWQWHQACAVAAVIRLRAEVARMSELEGTK